jgi:hypothetical protein
VQSDGSVAAERLGLRDYVKAFPELLVAAKEDIAGTWSLKSFPLVGAASLASRHSELRPALVELLRPHLSALEGDSKVPGSIFDAVWRADLRGFAPLLERLTSSTEPEDTPTWNSKRHLSRVILFAWRETDPLTKAKIDALLNGYIGGGSLAELLRTEFDALPANDQVAFRNLVTWMRTLDYVPWSRRLLEDVFTPHTPRPDVPLEF